MIIVDQTFVSHFLVYLRPYGHTPGLGPIYSALDFFMSLKPYGNPATFVQLIQHLEIKSRCSPPPSSSVSDNPQ